MSFVMVWIISSFIVFYTRFAGAVLNVSFFAGVVFTGLLWALGIGIALIVIWFIVIAIVAVMEGR